MAPTPAAKCDHQSGEVGTFGGLRGQARQAEERQRGDNRAQREHAEQPRRAVPHAAGGRLQWGMDFMLGGRRTIMGQFTVYLAGGEIVVRIARA